MRKLRFLPVLIFFGLILSMNCCNDDGDETFAVIEDISFENYPKVDGSTSTRVLNVIVACKLLGIEYEWYGPGIVSEWSLIPKRDGIPEEYEDFFWERVKSSQTHGAFLNLIDGNADIILTHRTISDDEQVHADSAGVTLIETPIASDAFVFVVNKANSVRSLTVDQVRQIYTGELTKWSQVGGSDDSIMVFTRPRNSGSEEVFRRLVMDGLEPADFPESYIGGMFEVFGEIYRYEEAICYTFNNYKETQARIPDSEVPKISINGIFPDNSTVKDGSYPFISHVHVAIRSDLSHNSMAYQLYEWLQSENAKAAIAESGFVPLE